jgi:hypothetical protein
LAGRGARFARPEGVPISDVLTPLTLDFLRWLAPAPRPYAEVMDVWRTSCPRLTVWEDAIDAGLVAHLHVAGEPAKVEATARGLAMLRSA